ncbi:aminodeoxychorismate synthase component I [Bacterioplanes sanyensis]|uniref:anthranilate synthase component I family protein n=1 Tax=Bacterioplanes sanyensis TaxID=1249553 RepID=UPI00167A9D6C|nr:anthranilate synthase component I family protein [Bacterioplanes sanyensis]GGY42306.1 aminodeoxychorismate synthase component I [Bacterioplanes sanyensis]
MAVLAFAPQRCLQANTAESLLDMVRQLNADVTGSHKSIGLAEDRFVSGWAGAFSYDAGQVNPANGLQGAADSQAPLAWFGYYPCSVHLQLDSDDAWIYHPDHLDTAPWREALQQLLQQPPKLQAAKARHWQAGWHLEQYRHAFERIQHYLRAGDCYQTNLTLPFECPDDLTEQSPLPLLQAFDAPHSGYLKTDDFTLFSVSPERFIRIQGQQLDTRPIKGTAPRGATPEEDQALLNELRQCPKNQAENLMIVDLLRNDLSRYATPGSVSVEQLFEPQSHANVHHLVSTIHAELKPDIGHAQAIFAALPGGSITGAPKRRAMEIISELEAGPRGFYCGSMGYFDERGVSDFNILIRTICARKNGAQCWGGGGIVLDSTAESEFQEVLNKVQRILDQPL